MGEEMKVEEAEEEVVQVVVVVEGKEEEQQEDPEQKEEEAKTRLKQTPIANLLEKEKKSVESKNKVNTKGKTIN